MRQYKIEFMENEGSVLHSRALYYTPVSDSDA